ncbi:hypothetical protein D3C86_2036440 [compost metagenome]
MHGFPQQVAGDHAQGIPVAGVEHAGGGALQFGGAGIERAAAGFAPAQGVFPHQVADPEIELQVDLEQGQRGFGIEVHGELLLL